MLVGLRYFKAVKNSSFHDPVILLKLRLYLFNGFIESIVICKLLTYPQVIYSVAAATSRVK